ncbi:hypothetical protein LTR37_010242 [Vermiconidia calcicola]|uniref:Uncharacterized protein n=1 Tax=Vermiconidia calcicola TaxID=1690605 RepID=A0ACC3N5M3_9PEZI|nr:hypothetical protein LTR37_010242 [Vermiconidia calcicola]
MADRTTYIRSPSAARTALPRTYTSSNLSHHSRPGSSRDTGYNGSEGLIDDTSSPRQFDGVWNEDGQVIASPRETAAPIRPAFGARFLSSLSGAQPAAAALTRKGSVLHSRAKSLAAYVPKLNTSNTPTLTPERVQAPNKIFGDLFNGESAPIRLGAPVSPTKEKDESEFVMEYTPTFTERPSAAFRRRDTGASAATTRPPSVKKSSWFNRQPTAASIPKPQQQQQDELATIDINQSLFPNGPADPLNPAAFNDLLLNATNLLQRMQAAYMEKVDYISSIQPEIDAQREEVEEADTRSKHLKFQMENMAQQLVDRDQAMQDMGRQLAQEKIRAQEARESARTVRLVPERRDDDDEETPTRRRKRPSDESASDSGFESDMDSVFSAHSGAETPLSPPMSSYRLRRKGLSSNKTGNEGAAWATVEALRNENQGLRVQMERMQGYFICSYRKASIRAILKTVRYIMKPVLDSNFFNADVLLPPCQDSDTL